MRCSQTYVYQYQPNCGGYSLLNNNNYDNYDYKPTKNEQFHKAIETTRFGDLTARIKYDWDFILYNVTLELTQQGKTIFEKIVAARIIANTGVSMSIRLMDLNNDGDPAVIIKYNSGTSGCCNNTLIYYFDYQKNKFNHLAYSLPRKDIKIKDIDGDGIWEIISKDTGFEEPSFFEQPTLIQHFIHGKFVNVTRWFPEKIREDNEQFSRALKSKKNSTNEYWKKSRRLEIAAYLANKYMLGEEIEGWDTINKVYQESDRKEFFDKLEEWLKQRGYDSE
ncbi:MULTISPECIES: hypothetical protein [Pseudanabaena]|uniref:VCBS repeat-containing protein n=2 Tax=Pseudanabaena TaxID=1152 RepID=L8MRT2_9CYAN|nr:MULTISPECIES: hypothetical protein [Pseudanabaena]ELS30146.1 hypothetical protein Pse7429DRAFT_4736 [Pseudanabaena biceps PCC 7429]MDG3497562.1 hypothetical protein [Pseudanabaena catenata USMAC16]